MADESIQEVFSVERTNNGRITSVRGTRADQLLEVLLMGLPSTTMVGDRHALSEAIDLARASAPRDHTVGVTPLKEEVLDAVPTQALEEDLEGTTQDIMLRSLKQLAAQVRAEAGDDLLVLSSLEVETSPVATLLVGGHVINAFQEDKLAFRFVVRGHVIRIRSSFEVTADE